MTDKESVIAIYITSSLGLAALRGENVGKVRNEMLARFGTYGLKQAEQCCKESIIEAETSIPELCPTLAKVNAIAADAETERIMRMSNEELAS